MHTNAVWRENLNTRLIAIIAFKNNFFLTGHLVAVFAMNGTNNKWHTTADIFCGHRYTRPILVNWIGKWTTYIKSICCVRWAPLQISQQLVTTVEVLSVDHQDLVPYKWNKNVKYFSHYHVMWTQQPTLEVHVWKKWVKTLWLVNFAALSVTKYYLA